MEPARRRVIIALGVSWQYWSRGGDWKEVLKWHVQDFFIATTSALQNKTRLNPL
jgi:hypothetical protein